MSDDSSLFSTTPGNTPQTFNVGVKRITGAQLLAAGKRKNWVYFITDIQVCAVYENAGRNVWLGTNGVPVAGDSTIQASLIPVQGQRFYNLTTGPQEWKGTSWGVGSYAISNKLTPRITIVEADMVLNPEVEHYVVVDGLTLTFPNDDYSSIETSMDVYVSPEVTGTVLAAPAGMTFTTPGQVGVNTLTLNPAGIYKLVRTTSNVIEVISTDNVDPVLRRSQNLGDVASPALARENLDVYSKEEVAAIAGFLSSVDVGLSITGNPASIIADPVTGFFRIALNYNTDPATVVNALPSDPPKPITAFTVRQAIEQTVENAVGISQYNNISGLAFDSTTFSLSKSANNLEILVGPAKWLFNVDPYLRNQAIQQRNMPAATLTPTLPAGPSYGYITLGTAGDYTASTSYNPLDFSRIIVGRYFAVDGLLQWVLPSPGIASSDMSLRISPLANTGGLLTFKTGGQWLRREASTTRMEGIGWSQAQASPHIFNVAAQDDVLFTIINDDGSIYAANVQHVKGNQLSDGGAVATTEYTVQIVYKMPNGSYYVPRPTAKYASKTVADAAVASVTYTKPTWMAEAIEVCRWVVKGDQFQGSGAYNLSVTTNFSATVISGTGGLGGAGGTNNWEVLAVTGGGTLQANKIYIIQDSSNYSFPAIGPVGLAFAAMAVPGATPTLTVQNYPTVWLRDMELVEDSDSIQLTTSWVLENFYSAGTYWGW